MVIVMVIDHYNSLRDGTVMSARRFRDELIRLGHTVRVVSYGVEGEGMYGLKKRHIPIVTRVSAKFNLTYAKFDKKIVSKAFEGADIVHLYMPFKLERKALKLAKSMNIPVSAAFHVHPENITRNIGIKRSPALLISSIFALFRKGFYDSVEHIHCPSAFTAAELEKYKYNKKLHIISNGVSEEFAPKLNSGMESEVDYKKADNDITNNEINCDITDNEQIAVAFDGKDNSKQTAAYKTTDNVQLSIAGVVKESNEPKKFEILMVGRLAAEKRQDLLINAVAASKYAKEINITFAGGGPKEKKIRKLSRKLPNTPVIRFFKQSELLNQIRSSDLYIHAADIEIEGISCIEAISCGLVPVIGNAEKSAAKQFAIDPQCIFEAGNYLSLKDRIEYWFENREKLAETSARYIEYSKQFSLENSVKKIVEMFKLVIEDNNNGGQKYGQKPLKAN